MRLRKAHISLRVRAPFSWRFCSRIRFKKLRDGQVTISDTIREWAQEPATAEIVRPIADSAVRPVN